MFKNNKLFSILVVSLLACGLNTTFADTVIKIHTIETGKAIGEIHAKDTPYGLLLTPKLIGLTPGIHGFHVHENPSCDDNGMAAGGHLDPNKTDKHLGPYDKNGHLGDLPPLYADNKGNVSLPVLAPRLKLATLSGHAIMIHEGGDNYSDKPAKLGGGALDLLVE